MGVSHSMNECQVDTVLTQFEATTASIQGIEQKVDHLKNCIHDMKDQRERLTGHAELATQILDNMTTSLNTTSDDVMDQVQVTLEAFAGPVEQFEVALYSRVGAAPRQMQRELGPLLMPAIVLVAIITLSNSVFGFLLAADTKLTMFFGMESVVGADMEEQQVGGFNIINLFAILHIVLIGLAVAYLFLERCRRVLRRYRQPQGKRYSILHFLAGWISDGGEDLEEMAGRAGQESPPSPSSARAARARSTSQSRSGSFRSPPVEEAEVRQSREETGSLEDLLSWANREDSRIPPEAHARVPSCSLRDVQQRVGRPLSSTLDPSAPARQPLQVGDLVVAENGHTVWAQDVHGTRRAWRLQAGCAARVVDVDGDGDVRLQSAEGQESGWVQREVFIPKSGSLPVGTASSQASMRAPPQVAGGVGVMAPGDSVRSVNSSDLAEKRSSHAPATREAALKTPVTVMLRRLHQKSTVIRSRTKERQLLPVSLSMVREEVQSRRVPSNAPETAASGSVQGEATTALPPRPA